MRIRHALVAAAVTVGALAAVTAAPAQAAEYSSALKLRGIQYDAPGRDDNRCSGDNTKNEYLTIRNYSRSTTVNLKGYVVKDAAGNKFTFTASHTLQPGDYVKLRGGMGTDSDAGNVVYRQNCNFMWNNDKDTVYFYKLSGARADVHSYTSPATTATATGTSPSTADHELDEIEARAVYMPRSRPSNGSGAARGRASHQFASYRASGGRPVEGNVSAHLPAADGRADSHLTLWSARTV
ncbi:hypothetical protein GCM10010384_66040 [Streptomyces djakartensis]|uniref:LTD domain-containing protein n=1 Tax=Streptomyces djakartensis TaxID=68193 RepID=A0ABQ3AFB9_9ACTN|nr:hypothetical protein GCM10010384_66040 [Streptomyces djakartensis]